MADERLSRPRPHPALVALAMVGGMTLVLVLFVLLAGGWAVRTFSGMGRGTSVGSLYFGQMTFEKAVAGIKLDGEIDSALTDMVLEKLEEAHKDTRVAGILLEINSPGGSVVSSQEIFDTVREIKSDEKTPKPVVVYVREMAASGAYYSAASANRIVANRGSLIGSIGVILSTVEATRLVDWLKLKPITIKTGALKDTGSPLREWTESDVSYMQRLIDETRSQFVEDVKSERELVPQAVGRMSDGRVVLGPEALELKLIDALGTKQDAVDAVAELAKLETTPELIYMEQRKEFPDLLSDLMRRESRSLIERLESELLGSSTAPRKLQLR